MLKDINKDDYIKIGGMFEDLCFQMLSETKHEYTTESFILKEESVVSLSIIFEKPRAHHDYASYLIVNVNGKKSHPHLIGVSKAFDNICYCYCLLDSILEDDHLSAFRVANMIDTIGDKMDEFREFERATIERLKEKGN